MTQQYERAGVLSIREVMPLLWGEEKKGNADSRVDMKGIKVHVTGLRLATFKRRGLKCVSCGVEGSHFALERSPPRNPDKMSQEVSPYHLNLYAIGADNKEVLMTHDHTIPRVAGGKNNLSNTRTMCSPCNSEKARGENPKSPGLYLWLRGEKSGTEVSAV